ncbi:MAG: hypothetical protein IT280_04040 [Ignavibacteria bacterium]|nr:hypothetical protein [Ignavibacteria bacterium]
MRDVSGKEIAIYSGSSLTQWNIWGLDNPPGGGQVVGKIPACRNGSSGRNADATRNYYLKDHLGSIRVVLNSTNTIVSAQDYDACLTYSASAEEVGYPLENRSYNTNAMKYDFTGKERNDETSYDYFGARYYDSRIGRWGQVDPKYDKYINLTPYLYTANNPIILKDVDGKDGKITIDHSTQKINIVINLVFIKSSQDPKYGLNKQQRTELKKFETNIESKWSGQKVEINGKEYTVNTEVNRIKANDTKEFNKLGNQEGNNFALSGDGNVVYKSNGGEPEGVGVVENKLYIDKNREFHADIGPHEAAHLLGLPDAGLFGYCITCWIQDENIGLMKPSEEDYQKILNNSKENPNLPNEKFVRSYKP